jgi:hypothetical protein
MATGHRSKIDLENTEGIWVTVNPKDAIPYLFMDSELESEEHQEALKYPEKYIFKVDIKGTTPVLVDGGTLFVRKRGGEKHGNE